ncbi:two-component system sensor histidine kinase AlgZ [Xanthomonas arboricola]|uniref:sensor histidine kinase n=1 Tax=Xanthomonas TaxID=338 RepID=UPI000F8D6770|nr:MULTISPECIES: histidine kinase [Xanthomonas]MBB3812001.1 two-component system sensor histidine kinase AlgZ [Xanthomonas euroxanthea]
MRTHTSSIPKRPLVPVGLHWAGIAVPWLVLALAYAPAVALTSLADKPRGALGLLGAFLFLVGSYVPWAALTPTLLWLSRRWIIGTGRSARHLALIALTGLVAIPVLTVLGWLLGHGLLHLAGFEGMGWRDLQGGQGALTATTLFAIPLYLVVMGAGQLWGHLVLRSERELLLARVNEQALRSRLHQHFIFNALNAIGELGYRDAARADLALGHVANLLRAMLESAPVLSLREEIGASAEFIELHQVLSGDITFNIDIEPRAWNAPVSSMALQPLLENAIQHGARVGGFVRIEVKAIVEDAELMITVVNPIGGDQPRGLGIGLDHLRRRLALTHGAAASLSTERQATCFVATLRLPVGTEAA